MATPYRIKRSSVTGKRPTVADLEKGELALNFYDGHLYAERDTGGVGIGTTVANLTPWKEQFSRDEVHYTGVVSATTYHGDQIIGTPTGGSFRGGAYTPVVTEKTKDSIDELNYILGKLVPTQPDNIGGVSLTLTGTAGNGRLCSGFTPTNNTNDAAPVAGTQYTRNIDSSVSTTAITDYGPGESGTLTGYVNTVSVGATTFGVSFGLYAAGLNSPVTSGAIRITNNTDAADSVRNTGISSLFYEVYDVNFLNAACPDGYNEAYITHGSNTTNSVYWYEDPSTVTDPVLSVTTTPITPNTSTDVVVWSSGVPHYTQSTNNAFNYVITCTNASGDMYTQNKFCTTAETTGFQDPGDKYYTNFAGGANPPARNFGVGSGVTCAVSQAPRNKHYSSTANNTKFSQFTASTPYGSGSVRATISESINIMGTSATTADMDEDNILISSLGTGSGNATRVNAGSTGDNPSPVQTTWDATNTPPAVYEAIVRGGDLRHDVENYSSGWLPAGGPDLSSGRTGSQYFQVLLTRTNVSQFNITYTGNIAGCWVCMPDNSAWTTSLSSTNGWADMFQVYVGAGVPSNANPGCSTGGAMDDNGGTSTCTFGTESSSNGGGKILVRWKLAANDFINTMSFAST